MDRTDEQLVLGYLAGDEVCFEMLIRRYQGPILRLTRRLTGDAGLAEDAAQDAFLVAARSLETLEEPGKFRAWLYRIAQRKGTLHMNRRRRDRLTKSLPQDELPDPVTETGQSLRHEPESVSRFRRLLSRVHAEVRNWFSLKFVDGFTYVEIGGIVGVNPATVRKRVQRAKADLIARYNRGEGIGT